MTPTFRNSTIAAYTLMRAALEKETEEVSIDDAVGEHQATFTETIVFLHRLARKLPNCSVSIIETVVGDENTGRLSVTRLRGSGG